MTSPVLKKRRPTARRKQATPAAVMAAAAPGLVLDGKTPEEVKAILNDAIVELSHVKAQQDILAAQHTALEKVALDALRHMGRKSSRVLLDDGSSVTGTLVQGHRYVTDDARLKKRVGAVVWSKITTPTIDKTKLEAAIKSGLLKATAIAECTDSFLNKPYVKVTVKGQS